MSAYACPVSRWMRGRWALSFCALWWSKPSAAGMSWMLQAGERGVWPRRQLAAGCDTRAALSPSAKIRVLQASLRPRSAAPRLQKWLRICSLSMNASATLGVGVLEATARSMPEAPRPCRTAGTSG